MFSNLRLARVPIPAAMTVAKGFNKLSDSRLCPVPTPHLGVSTPLPLPTLLSVGMGVWGTVVDGSVERNFVKLRCWRESEGWTETSTVSRREKRSCI